MIIDRRTFKNMVRSENECSNCKLLLDNMTRLDKWFCVIPDQFIEDNNLEEHILQMVRS